MDNTRSIMNSITTAKNGYNSIKVSSESKYSFSGFLTLLSQTNKALSSARSRLEIDKAENIKKYSKQVSDEKNNELTKAFAVQVKTNKEKLYSRLDEIMTAKRSAIEKYVLINVPDDLMKTIQTIQFRIQSGGKISDTEWNMIVRRISDSGNYQALTMLHDLAISIKQDFSLPFEVDDKLSDLDDAETILKSVIDGIETQEHNWSLRMFTILSDKPNETKNRLIAMDSMLGISVEEKQKTVIERLKESAQMALHAGDTALFNETYAFIADNRDKLMTTAESEQDIKERAEDLISRGMSANEK